MWTMAFVAVFIIFSILLSVLVVTASMLSSRLSRVEDGFLAEELEVENSPPTSVGSEAPMPAP